MTQTNGEESRRYRTIWPENTKQQIRELSKQADQLGVGQPFLSALKEVEEFLRSDPVSFGEVLRVLKETGLEERHGTHSLFSVRYAVDRSLYLVYVLSCACVGHGFRDV